MFAPLPTITRTIGGREVTINPNQRGCLPVGTVTNLGTIGGRSLTAYRIGGGWVPFDTIHGAPVWAERLVTFNA